MIIHLNFCIVFQYSFSKFLVLLILILKIKEFFLNFLLPFSFKNIILSRVYNPASSSLLPWVYCWSNRCIYWKEMMISCFSSWIWLIYSLIFLFNSISMLCFSWSSRNFCSLIAKLMFSFSILCWHVTLDYISWIACFLLLLLFF